MQYFLKLNIFLFLTVGDICNWLIGHYDVLKKNINT